MSDATTPAKPVRAPASAFIAVRVNEPEIGKLWKNPPTKFANPWPTSSWLMSTGSLVFAETVFPVACVCTNATSAIMPAFGISERNGIAERAGNMKEGRFEGTFAMSAIP